MGYLNSRRLHKFGLVFEEMVALAGSELFGEYGFILRLGLLCSQVNFLNLMLIINSKLVISNIIYFFLSKTHGSLQKHCRFDEKIH